MKPTDQKQPAPEQRPDDPKTGGDRPADAPPPTSPEKAKTVHGDEELVV